PGTVCFHPVAEIRRVRETVPGADPHIAIVALDNFIYPVSQSVIRVVIGKGGAIVIQKAIIPQAMPQASFFILIDGVTRINMSLPG
ncbi:MAG: hypothetical protein QGG54_18870, partial [Gammaproteobacteria bacterium]|nr:hypothetical protein [Gammaproteobacteria bacterium]